MPEEFEEFPHFLVFWSSRLSFARGGDLWYAPDDTYYLLPPRRDAARSAHLRRKGVDEMASWQRKALDRVMRLIQAKALGSRLQGRSERSILSQSMEKTYAITTREA